MFGNGVVGILKEAHKRERRAPLTPAHCAKLLQQNASGTGIAKIIVQPCSKRIHPDSLYKDAGCELAADVTACGLILGVKRPDLGTMLPDRSYAFFSHAHKSQPDSLPLLDEVLQKNITLLDYELIASEDGRKMVAFGRFAGRAGMLDFLRGLGERFLTLGFATPFLGLGYSHMYPSLSKAKEAVTAIGEEIKRNGLPAAICPLVFVFTGRGNVGQGAMEIFELLPHAVVSAQQLPDLGGGVATNGESCEQFKSHVYGCLVDASNMVEHNDPTHTGFDKAHYYSHPEEYHPVFHERVAPYASVIVNCMFWERRFPRLLTIDQLHDIFVQKKRPSPNPGKHIQFMGIADITCDLKGSIECVNTHTTIDQPFFMYDPLMGSHHANMDGEGIIIMAVDVLPTKFPGEATQHFSHAIQSWVRNMACATTLDTMVPPLQKACITFRGKLTPKFEHLTNTSQQVVEPLAPPQTPSGSEGPSHPSSMVSSYVFLSGNLIDSFLINVMLDIIVENDGNFELETLDSNDFKTDAIIFIANIKISTEDQLALFHIKNLIINQIDPTHEFLTWSS